MTCGALLHALTLEFSHLTLTLPTDAWESWVTAVDNADHIGCDLA